MSRTPLPNKDAGLLRILFVGDVYGKPGVQTIASLLPGLLREYGVDFCIVNGENADNGKGISPPSFNKLKDAGADAITGGNHVLYRDRSHSMFDEEPSLLRPLNFPDGSPGRGCGVFEAGRGYKVAVMNLMGRALMPLSDDPFRAGKRQVEDLKRETKLIVVDFHAEATAEKIAFSKYVDGEVTAVIGTHTHVQTADEVILPGGTAYLTDAGMTGSHAGVIGMATQSALKRFLYPVGGGRADGAEGDERISGVIVDADPETGTAKAIYRIQRRAR